MTENDDATENAPPTVAEFSGEENTAEQSSPAKDFGSAIVIATIAIAVAFMSVRLDVPGSAFTAPGLLPLVTSLSLLLMAVALGTKAVRSGGAAGFGGAASSAVQRYLGDTEGRRALLLIGIVVAYVILVGQISFSWRIPTPIFVFQISSYEVISFFVISTVMKLFWRAPLWRCVLISLLTVEVLAAIFRYGFGIIMPESF